MERYKIVRASGLDGLEREVKRLMDFGYVPTGGVTQTDRAYSQYIQAVYLPEEVASRHFARVSDHGMTELDSRPY